MTGATGADRLLQALADHGVAHLIGNPGSTELPITEAAGRQDRVAYVLGLHEAAVMGMADGYAQTTGRLAAVNVHVQPGLANAMSGLLNAARCRVPLLVTVGQQVQELLPQEPFLGGELVELARPFAKAALEARRPGELPELIARAIRTALAPPRGPVVLSLPLDVQAAPVPAVPPAGPQPPVPPPLPEALDRAAAVLAGARAPVVIAGDAVVHAGGSAALAAVAERLGAPIHGEPMGAMLPLASDHPLWAGPLPAFAAEIAPLLEPHDVVLAAGMPVFRLFGISPGPALPDGLSLVHLEVDPHEVGKVHAPAAGLVGDVAAGLAGLRDRLGSAPPDAVDRRARAEEAVDAARRAARARVERAAGGGRVGPAALACAIAATVAEDELVVDEALTSARGLRAVIGRRTPDTWLAHRGSALGWGLPAAVGAALARPGRRVLALQGDGGLVFGAPALWTAAHEGLPLAVVVADNGGYEILRAGMEGMTGSPEGPWPGLALRDPPLDVAAICRGFGASAARAERSTELPEALDDLRRRAADGPAVLVVAVTGRTPPVGYPLTPGRPARGTDRA